MAHTLHRMRSFIQPRLRLVEGASLSLGIFFLLSIALWIKRGHTHDLSTWLIDLRAMPSSIRAGILGCLIVGFVGFAMRPNRCATQRLAVAAASVVALFALLDSIRFVALLSTGAINAAHPIPVSIGVLAIAIWIGFSAAYRSRNNRHTQRTRPQTAIVFMIAAMLLPCGSLIQMLGFGRTDYRRPADAAVVFGSRVYEDGTLSLALADRVQTACDLFHEGLVTHLVMSGGPGDGSVHEVEAMRRSAVELGVPTTAITLDYDGLNTRGTIGTVTRLRDRGAFATFLMVSHGYHLPRVKMECDRQGLQAFTVPARETRVLQRLPWFMAREAAAQWSYLLRPLV